MNKFDFIDRKIEMEEDEDVKLWLFWENVRIKAERQDLEEQMEQFREDQEKLKEEAARLKREQEFLARKQAEEQQLFEKKVKVLEDAYRQMERDKKRIERESRAIEKKRIALASQTGVTVDSDFFRGVNSIPTLKKRYKDLSRIYHPDNVNGDEWTFTEIKKEYERLNELLKEE